MAYDRHFEPIGNEAERFAKLMALVVQVAGGDSSWEDFMPNAAKLKAAARRRRMREAEQGGIRVHNR